ncbi:MAG: M28 family metallopeptidase [Solirubrobacterales bacterium]
MDAAHRRELIEELCSFEGRWPGTDAERRAANRLAERLRSLGRKAAIEPTYVHPEYSMVIAAHVVLAIAGSLLALVLAPLGFVLVLVAATSLYLDQNTRLYLIRSLFFRRASQNVVSPGTNPSAPARLILSAHYDAAKTGLVFGPRSARAAKRISETARLLLGPIRLIFWAGIVPLLTVTAARLGGVEGDWLGIVQLIPTTVLLISLALLIDIALSGIVPGAYDNASGVAAVLSVTQRLDAEPPRNLDIWVVLPGAEECNCEGMARWVAAHRRELDREKTFFVNLDSVSYGDPHYLASEGAIVSYNLDRRMLELCEAIATADREDGDRYRARPIRIPFHSDALPANTRGFRAISVVGADDGVAPPYYHTHADTPDKVDDNSMTRSIDFTVELVRQLDREVGRQRSDP